MSVQVRTCLVGTWNTCEFFSIINAGAGMQHDRLLYLLLLYLQLTILIVYARAAGVDK